ncbi:hypothetical protein A2U01_0113380, partial [Trifolium medium]|nr:hypothetical protein [Trifolium medium]
HDEQRAHDIVSEDSYQSDLQDSSAAPQAPPDAPRPVAAPPDAVESLHVRDVQNA